MSGNRIQLIVVYLGLIAAVGFGYANCSPVRFAVDTESSLRRLNVDGGILINGGAEFTNKQDVGLNLINSSASDMYITEDSTCETGGTWEKMAINKPWHLSDANKEVKVFAKFRDAETQVESSCFNDGIVHDDIAPVISISKSVAAFINATQAAVSFSIVETGSGIDSQECLLDAGNRIACLDNHVRMGLTEGPHAIQIVAVDKAGNVAIPVQSAFVVDLTKPILVLNLTPPKITGSTAAEFQFVGTDALSGVDKYECRNSAMAPWEACVSPRSFTATEGSQTATFRVYDKAGNVSDDLPYSWAVDLTAPTVTITKHPEPFEAQGIGKFEFVGVDGAIPLVKYECAVDNIAAYAACVSPFATAALGEGNHTFYVRGYDAAGNVSAPASFVWMIDMTAPTVKILSGPPAVTPLKDANITFLGTDNGSGLDHYECNLNGGAFTKCTSPDVLTALADNTYTVSVIAFDKVGNKSAPASHVFRVDTTKPTIEITKTPLAETKDRSATFEFVAKDPGGEIAEIGCSLDSATGFMPCTSPTTFNIMVDGVHTFYVRATDKAGNVSDVKNYSWLLDTTAPVITINSQPPATIVDANPYTLAFTVTDAGVGVKSVTCKLDGVDKLCTEKFSEIVDSSKNMAHVFTIHAEDKLGNFTDLQLNWSVNIIVKNVTVTLNDKEFVCSPFGGGDTAEKSGLKSELRYVDSTSALSADQKSNILAVDYFKDGDVNITKFPLAVYLSDVNVPTRAFSSGFQSSDGSFLKDKNGQNLIEYFALRMESVIRLGAADLEGYYEFSSISDDGAVVQVQMNGVWTTILSHDGPHSAGMKCMTNNKIFLDKKSRLPIRIFYNQGPRTEIANVLMWNYRGPTATTAANVPNDTTIHKYCGTYSQSEYWNPSNNSAIGPFALDMFNNQAWKVLKAENFLLPNDEVNPCSFSQYDLKPKLTVVTMSASNQVLKYESTDSTTVEIKVYRMEGMMRTLVNTVADANEALAHTFNTGDLDPKFAYQIEITATVPLKKLKVFNLYDLKFQ